MNSSYWLNFEELWSTWPSRQLSGELKWYYLVVLAFWLQQVLSINLEKRRKDFGQMFLHHCVTSFLIYVSYAYRWTNVGNVTLCIMDVVDFILPVYLIRKLPILKPRLTWNSLRKCSNTYTTKLLRMSRSASSWQPGSSRATASTSTYAGQYTVTFLASCPLPVIRETRWNWRRIRGS